MIYVWAAILIAILFLVWQIVRWWNLPKTIENRQKAQEARSKAWADWRANRPRLFGRRTGPATPINNNPSLPKPEPKPDDKPIERQPVPDEVPRPEPKPEPEAETPREGGLGSRIRQRRQARRRKPTN